MTTAAALVDAWKIMRLNQLNNTPTEWREKARGSHSFSRSSNMERAAKSHNPSGWIVEIRSEA